MYCQWLSFDACFWGQVWQICDKFLSTPYHPYGVPPYLVFLRDTQSPEKNPGNQLLQEYGDFTWSVPDREKE